MSRRKWLRLCIRVREFVPYRKVRFIGTERPPEHVFRFFRRLHGLEQGGERE